MCNIKISVYFKNNFFLKKKSSKKTIYKQNSWNFTIYHHTPNHVNATGIKRIEDIEKVISYLECEYNNKCIRHQIDCAMVSHKDNKKIKMNVIGSVLKTISSLYYLDYEPEIFTGAFLKPNNRDYPTINLFYTGSFQLLGGKSLEKIDESIVLVRNLIQKCSEATQVF